MKPVTDHTSCREEIEKHSHEIARAASDYCFREKPELLERYGEKGRTRCTEDSLYHIRYLAEAIGSHSPQLFTDYVEWTIGMLAGYNIPPDDLRLNLEGLVEAVGRYCSKDCRNIAGEYVATGNEAIESNGEKKESEKNGAASGTLPSKRPHAPLAKEYLDLLLEGDRHGASALILSAVDNGVHVRDIYLHVFAPSQYEVGRLWQQNRITVAQEHFCTAATQTIMSRLYGYIFTAERKNRSMVGVSVGGELHEIGVRMVADFFEMEGWDTYYVGANVPIESVVHAVVDQNADLLAISATMTFHIQQVRKLIEAIRANPASAEVKVMVGGYPFNIDGELWRKVGADGYSPDAASAVSTADKLVG